MKSDRKIFTYRQTARLRKTAGQSGTTIVLTTGCFDILHLGHVLHFSYCKTKGDILVVSVGNDETVRHLKGPARPIHDERFRARMVAALECVDYVVISEEFGKLDHVKLMQMLKPDYYVVPVTDSLLAEKRQLAADNEGVLITCRRLPPGNLKDGISSTGIERKLREL
ncbi:MAG: adenylyltransferase/cytidyltransferase family protein [Candidatus Latescibacterota bacterium]